MAESTFRIVVTAAAVLLGGCGGPNGGQETASCVNEAVVGDLPCEVADVLQARCQSCHTDPPTGGAKFPLLTYEDLADPLGKTGKRKWQRIAEVIQPDGLPHMPYGAAPQLSDAELATLQSWLAACAPPAAEGAGCDDGGALLASVDLPGGAVGIGLDDLRFSTTLDRIVVAAGRTGAVDLVDPDTLEVTSIAGFTAFPDFNGGDQQGVQSADEGNGLVFAVDRSAYTLGVVDPAANAIVASVRLDMTEPDYVRWVEPTSEVWITNPGSARIDVLSVAQTSATQAAFIAVPGGVEGLAIDRQRKRAYTHSSGGKLTVIDVESRQIVASWATGCSSEHGIPVVDEARGLVFAGCGQTEVKVLDQDADGQVLGSYALGSGTTILAYSPSLRHFYLRGDPGSEVAILGIPESGMPTLLGTLTTPNKGHCATADDRGNVWVCDWENGRLVRYPDPYPATE